MEAEPVMFFLCCVLIGSWMNWFEVHPVSLVCNVKIYRLTKNFLNSTARKSSLLGCWKQKWVFVGHDVVCCPEIHLQLQNHLLKVLLSRLAELDLHRQHFDGEGGKTNCG